MDNPTFGEIVITPMSDTPKLYSEMVSHARNRMELQEGIARFGELAWDAYEQASRLEDWTEFRRALRSERNGTYMGDELAQKYMAILLPEPMFAVSIVAATFSVPFGLALIRLLETGNVYKEDGKLNVDSLRETRQAS